MLNLVYSKMFCLTEMYSLVMDAPWLQGSSTAFILMHLDSPISFVVLTVLNSRLNRNVLSCVQKQCLYRLNIILMRRIPILEEWVLGIPALMSCINVVSVSQRKKTGKVCWGQGKDMFPCNFSCTRSWTIACLCIPYIVNVCLYFSKVRVYQHHYNKYKARTKSCLKSKTWAWICLRRWSEMLCKTWLPRGVDMTTQKLPL